MFAGITFTSMLWKRSSAKKKDYAFAFTKRKEKGAGNINCKHDKMEVGETWDITLAINA